MNLLRFCEDKELKQINPVGLINPSKSVKQIRFYIGKNKLVDKVLQLEEILIF